MKKSILGALTALIISGLLFVQFGPRTYTPITKEQRTSHMIYLYNSSDKPFSECTATAIGPHALLTAAHCDEFEQAVTVGIDLSTNHYPILRAIIDRRDHVAYLLDNPPFKNYLDPKLLTNVRQVEPDEPVHLFGAGDGRYPPRKLTGSMSKISQAEDPSDVDEYERIIWYTFKTEPGDSGSAIFGEDGRVVGVLSLGMSAHKDEKRSEESCGFALNYPEEAIAYFYKFDPVPYKMMQLLVGGPSLK